jgi:hypothetical protein
MARRLGLILVGVLACGAAHAAESKSTRFWNLTGETVTHLYLAPAGTGKWGSDQCRNDPDGTIDFDERLRIDGVGKGRYDAKLVQQSGRTCIVRNIEIKPGGVFSVGKDEMAHCGG